MAETPQELLLMIQRRRLENPHQQEVMRAETHVETASDNSAQLKRDSAEYHGCRQRQPRKEVWSKVQQNKLWDDTHVWQWAEKAYIVPGYEAHCGKVQYSVKGAKSKAHETQQPYEEKEARSSFR